MICVVLGCTILMSGASYFINELLVERGLNDVFLDQIEAEIKQNI